MTGSASGLIRPIGEADRSDCASFTCRGTGQPWRAEIEDFVRHDLVDVVVGGFCEGLGLWLNRELAGIVTWMADDGPPLVWEVTKLATNQGYQRKGVATRLKQEVIRRAEQQAVQVVASLVHRDNEAMQALNEQKFKASVRSERLSEYLIYTIRLR